jgi:hypothetical protein
MRELQKAFYPDPVDFRVREEENGMSEVQESQSQAANILLSNGDVQEKLNCLVELQGLLESERTDSVLDTVKERLTSE